MVAGGIERTDAVERSEPLHENLEAEYAQARTGAVVIDRSHEGRLRAAGRDRLDLLQRMSTNDLDGLGVGEARLTVLTTAIGRMVDLLWVFNRGETLMCLSGPGRATPVRRWLAGHIFYNDQVQIEDISEETRQIGIFGPRASEVAETLIEGAGALQENRFVERGGELIARGRPLAGDGYALIVPAARRDEVWAKALDAGAAQAGEATYQALRLAAGAPYAGHEITDEYIPLEANLWSAVSFTKGCYIGQEIIARMESRGQLARRLVVIKLEAPVEPGSPVEVGGVAVGRVTSAGAIPGTGPAALAYLKAAHAEPDTRVSVKGVSGTVATLPLV